MKASFLKGRYALLFNFILFFLSASFIVRLILLIISFSKAAPGLVSILTIFSEGLLFDLGVAIFFSIPYGIYLLLFPARWNNTLFNKVVTYLAFFLATLIIMFSFFAEITFWQEFESRFNFIAVDYLVYTYEVINNINESYPLPLLISGMVILTLLVIFVFHKKRIFSQAFRGRSSISRRILISGSLVGAGMMYAFFISNTLAERGINRYQDELSKAGIYSFFSAFKNNELNYDQFYPLINSKEAFNIVRKQVSDNPSDFGDEELSVKRDIKAAGIQERPNVIMVTIESFSAGFMEHFGNKNKLTPVLDSLADQSIFFTQMYSTGTRTVRGMEALSLALPPTPGNSIVRRPDNDNLQTVGYIFRQKGYTTEFFYGGDGYFDNMDKFFGNNGYEITDKRHSPLIKESFKEARNTIPDSLVHFENAWGICDEDLYDAVLRDADQKEKEHHPFYDFVMTTSNHRPYTYPEGRIDIPSGTGREGAVKYTDYAIGHFLQEASKKPWFDNTVFIFIADHCASSAGVNEIDVANYHIPAIIYNYRGHKPEEISAICSQIDLYPTLFNLMNWPYTSNLFGQNVLAPSYQPRTFVGTYQKLGYLQRDSLVILGPQQKIDVFRYDRENNTQTLASNASKDLIDAAIANYQAAYYLYKHRGLKQ